MSATRTVSGAVAAAAIVLSVSGCATMQSEPMELDEAYIAYVENAAKLYATQVIWVNYPMRPARAQQQTPAPEAK